MRRGLFCLLTLAAALPAAVRADPGPSPPPVPPPVLAPFRWSPEAAIRDGTVTCGTCRTVTTRFMVGNEYHRGVYLMREDNPDERIWVVFASSQVGEQIARYFSPDNMPSLIGKRVYCDCIGVSYDGGTISGLRRQACLPAESGPVQVPGWI